MHPECYSVHMVKQIPYDSCCIWRLRLICTECYILLYLSEQINRNLHLLKRNQHYYSDERDINYLYWLESSISTGSSSRSFEYEGQLRFHSCVVERKEKKKHFACWKVCHDHESGAAALAGSITGSFQVESFGKSSNSKKKKWSSVLETRDILVTVWNGPYLGCHWCKMRPLQGKQNYNKMLLNDEKAFLFPEVKVTRILISVYANVSKEKIAEAFSRFCQLK